MFLVERQARVVHGAVGGVWTSVVVGIRKSLFCNSQERLNIN